MQGSRQEQMWNKRFRYDALLIQVSKCLYNVFSTNIHYLLCKYLLKEGGRLPDITTLYESTAPKIFMQKIICLLSTE